MLNNATNKSNANPESPREFCFSAKEWAVRVLFSYCSYLFPSQNLCHAFLVRRINHTVFLRRLKQMVGINASGIIAFTTNFLEIGYRTVVKQPRCSMCVIVLRVIASFRNSTMSTDIACGANPVPAFSKFWTMGWYSSVFVHSIPEPIGKVNVESLRDEKLGRNVRVHNVSLFDVVPRFRLLHTARRHLNLYGNSRIFSTIIALLSLVCGASAGDLTGGVNFVNGQTVTANTLNNAFSLSTINPFFYYNKPLDNSPLPSDYIVIYSPTLGAQLYRSTLQNAVFGNGGAFTTLTPGFPSFTNGADLFRFYSVGNTNVMSITYSNLVLTWRTNFPLVLTPYPYTFSPNFTNNMPSFMTWGTNGVAYSVTFSNLVQVMFPTIATNEVPYVFQQIFTPWTFIGTNAAFTNAWGYTNVFPITNLFMSPTNIATLTATDSIPIFSNQQGSNTTATIGAIYQYVTNQTGGLPAYTQARVQFSGVPLSITVSNTTSTANSTILAMTNLSAGFTTNFFATNQIYAVNFITNATALWAGLTTNQVYYVVPTATNAVNGEWVHVCSNYTSAQGFLATGSLTNCIGITASGISGAGNVMLYLTNYTGFNADATQVTVPGAPNTTRTGVYDVWFRTPAVNALYYMTGTAFPNNNSTATTFGWSIDNLITTNRVRVESLNASTFVNAPLIHVLISPQ